MRRKQETTSPSPLQSVHPIRFRNRQFRLCRCLTMNLKGRIIGREGRNIRTLETLTGVDLIIDDTPEAITLSCFDQVRREIARIALEKLIADGRIHPTKIEEMVEKAKREVEQRIRVEGEHAVLETNVHGINNEMIKLLGRLYYRTSYRAERLEAFHRSFQALRRPCLGSLGLDANMARRAGLLHDIGKALTAEIEGSHVQIGVDVCKKYNESPEIIHAVEAHHNDVEPSNSTCLYRTGCGCHFCGSSGSKKRKLRKLHQAAATARKYLCIV